MTTADETMRIDADGNLLLNNTSAGARLDIREDTNYAIRAEDASGHYFRVNTGGDVDMRGDLTVQGIITAQEFHTEFVSASIIYDSGSTKFGDTSDDVHNFTGSVNVKSLSTGVKLNLEDDTAKTELQHNLHAFRIKVDPDNADTNSNFRVEIDGSEKFRIQNNGNVGIGTTSPASKLHISSSNFNDHITLGRGSDELGISVSGAQILVEGGLSPFNNDSEDLGRSDKHWQDLYITDNIYVSQSATLTLNGELDVTGLISGSDINIDDWGSVSASLASIQTEGVEGSGTANHITKWSDSDTVTSSGMFQAASGNFSIGITTPNAKLSVVNDISIGTSATDVLRLHNEIRSRNYRWIFNQEYSIWFSY